MRLDDGQDGGGWSGVSTRTTSTWRLVAGSRGRTTTSSLTALSASWGMRESHPTRRSLNVCLDEHVRIACTCLP